MKITICDVNYKHANYYLRTAREFGYLPFEDQGDYKVEVLPAGHAWRDPAAKHSSYGDDIYVFEFVANKFVSAHALPRIRQ